MKFMILADIPWYAQILAVIFVLICIILIVIVLLQKGRGGGLSAAFGGAGGHSAFGSKTGDVFTKITIGIVAVFLILSMVLTKIWVPFIPEDRDAPALQSSPGQGTGQPSTSSEQTPGSSEDTEAAGTPSEPKPTSTPPETSGSTTKGQDSEASGNPTGQTQSDKPKEGN